MSRTTKITQDGDQQVADLEQAYRDAMAALDSAEQQAGTAFEELADTSSAESDEDQAAIGLNPGEQLANDLASHPAAAEPETRPGRVRPRQIVEAALFVGGMPLTARKLASLIGADTDKRYVVQQIERLNQLYADENRPYHIVPEEGGYLLQPREEFDAVRNRVFGLGPREVRLSSDALELLSFVAYEQPVAKGDLDQSGKENAKTVLRQLIRLRLVEVERIGNSRQDVTYRTTDRFLDLFGLKSLEELPRADVFGVK